MPEDKKKQKKPSAAQSAYLKSLTQHRRRILLARLGILVVFLLLWEVSSRLSWIDSFIFSSPSSLVQTTGELLMNRDLVYHISLTLGETLISFFISTLLGIMLAIILWWFPSLYEATEPYWVALNSLPKSALAPILIVWFGNTIRTTIITSIMLTIVVTVLTVLVGFQESEGDQARLIYALGGNKKQVMTKVLLPGNIPVIMNVLRVNIGLSLIGVIIGEFLSAKAGLGYLIIYGSQIFKMDWVLLSIVLLCLLAAGLYGLLGVLGRRISQKFN